MDFGLDPTATAVRDAAAEVFARHRPHWESTFGQRGESPETGGADHDPKLWQSLVDAGLITLALPESVGGDAVGVLAVMPLLRRMGESAAVTPALGALTAALLLPTFAESARGRLAQPLARGQWHAVAVAERGRRIGPPATSVRDGRLNGTKIGVMHAEGAHSILVSAADGVYAVGRDAEGVRMTRTHTSSGAGEYTVEFSDVVVEPPLLDDPTLLDDVHRIILCGYADGLISGAVGLTAEHVSTRHQFGRPIALFQAVGQQLADAYIVARAMNLSATAAAWRLSQGLDARRDLAIGTYWLAAEIPATMRTVTHLHGGIGVDITYPLHRYFSIAKDLARLVGTAYACLDDLIALTSAAPADTDRRPVVPARETTMQVELTAEQRALRDELREYFTDLVDDDAADIMLTERHGPTYRQVIARMGSDRRLGVGWPKEYGGKGFGEIEQQIFTNEAVRADVPLPSVTLQTVGPTLQVHGSAEQKERFLPAILAGEVHFAIGYTEPEAGTDLASLTTTAVREGDHYIVNGQKIFTTGGHDADYIWLAVRTDKDVPKHKGISILIVDTTDPGFSWTPIITADGAHHVNATYYNDVRVPVSMRVGEEGDGWKLITTQLNHERVMLGPAGRIEGLAHRARRWADATPFGGGTVGEIGDVARALAEIDAHARINELLNWQVAATGEAISMADAAATKVFSTERLQRIGRQVDDIVGRHGDPADPSTAALMRWLDVAAKRNVVITFGGGVNEVMREMIATSGLGLPRAPR